MLTLAKLKHINIYTARFNVVALFHMKTGTLHRHPASRLNRKHGFVLLAFFQLCIIEPELICGKIKQERQIQKKKKIKLKTRDPKHLINNLLLNI